MKRPCNVVLTPKGNKNTQSSTTLPFELYSSSDLIVADLTYTYQPIFAPGIFGAMTISRRAYLQPRYVDKLTYTAPNGDSNVTVCNA